MTRNFGAVLGLLARSAPGVKPEIPSGPQIDPERARLLMRRATNLAVAAAALMIVGKLGAWLATDSVSILSSLADSVMDVLASLINLYAVRQALQPPDREHRFGHGKAEPLAGLGQALFISASAIFLIVEAVGRILEPEPIARAPVGIGVMVFATIVTTALVTYQRRVVRLTGSTAIRADALHYASDILMNIGVIAALALAMTVGWGLADPIIALVIAAVIIHAAVRVARSAIQQLMDREFPEQDRERIRQIVLEHPDVLNCHDLRTRRSGIDSFIQVHVEMGQLAHAAPRPRDFRRRRGPYPQGLPPRGGPYPRRPGGHRGAHAELRPALTQTDRKRGENRHAAMGERAAGTAGLLARGARRACRRRPGDGGAHREL